MTSDEQLFLAALIKKYGSPVEIGGHKVSVVSLSALEITEAPGKGRFITVPPDFKSQTAITLMFVDESVATNKTPAPAPKPKNSGIQLEEDEIS